MVDVAVMITLSEFVLFLRTDTTLLIVLLHIQINTNVECEYEVLLLSRTNILYQYCIVLFGLHHELCLLLCSYFIFIIILYDLLLYYTSY